MDVQFLNPAMSSLSVKDRPVQRRSSDLAIPASKSCLGLTFAGAPATAQVQINWKNILIQSVQILGGTKPVYIREDNMDAMVQTRISFRLPLDMTGSNFRDIAVNGIKCPTLPEAENEASILALEKLQDGILKIGIVDVSRTRCRELKKSCDEILDNSVAIYDVAKSLFLEWEEDMNKAEDCYSPSRRRLTQDTCPKTRNTPGISPVIADKVATITSSYYVRLTELPAKTEEVKKYIDSAHEQIKCFFCEPHLQEVNDNRGRLPQELKLSMKLILQEMMMSIGWAWPHFNVSSLGMSLYVCETTVLPNHVHVGPAPKALTITGSEADSEEEAIEDSCRAAISFLEREKSLCLVDLNFNHRTHGELYVVEAGEAVQFGSFMISKIFAEWEAMLDEIQACEEYCHKMLVVQSSQEESDYLVKMKQNSIEIVQKLCKACRDDLSISKARVSNTLAGNW